MNNKEMIKEQAYLYSVWSGRLMTYEGDVYKFLHVHDGNIARFTSKTKSFSCSVEPGVVYNSVVWLTDRNDELAHTLLIEYEESQISILQLRIDNHLHKIKIIKENNKS